MAFDQVIQAVQSLNAEDSFRPRLDARQWQLFGEYFNEVSLRSGEVLVKYRDMERTVYLLEQGTLQVYVPLPPQSGRRPVAILRPGSIVGEAAMFGDSPRMAQVEAMSPCIAWALPRHRFDEMTLRQTALAMEVMRSLGAVMVARMQANLERGLPMA
jgi:CRP/FNR family transcriptional regulator, cyclic AMP receptor protein